MSAAIADVLFLTSLAAVPVLVGLLAWGALALVAAVLMGRGIRLADVTEARTEELDLSMLDGRTDTVLIERTW